jgi:hypothetical protein
MTKSFNSNIKYNGKIYHIQTEVYKEHVVTQIFDGGKIVKTFKNKFTDFKSTVNIHKKAEELVSTGSFIKI